MNNYIVVIIIISKNLIQMENVWIVNIIFEEKIEGEVEADH